MSAEFTMSANAHHPRLKTIFVHDDGQLSIVLGGEKYAHVSLITTYAEWRQLVRDVDQEMARQSEPAARLEHLRGRLHAQNISYGELAELQSLADHIQPGDVELAEAAGIDEHEFTELQNDQRQCGCGAYGDHDETHEEMEK